MTGACRFHFLTHPEVIQDTAVPVTAWPLSARGATRLRAALDGPCFTDITAIHCSTERKAGDAAGMVAGHLGLPVTHHGDLGENDRSSTGYLPPTEFEATADRFFAEPDKSARGWARAIDEQARIVGAIQRISRESNSQSVDGVDGTTLIIAHGAVGALLMADLLDEPISRRLDQPGGGGGNWFAFRADAWRLLEGWRVMGIG